MVISARLDPSGVDQQNDRVQRQEMKPLQPNKSFQSKRRQAEDITFRVCPVCGGNEKKRLIHQTFSGLSSGSFLHGYDVVVCAQCGTGFADGLPAAWEFDRYYKEMSQWEFPDNFGIESAQDKQRFESVTGYMLEEKLDLESSILDVGCATGGLLAAFKRGGFTRLKGLDPSLRCAELARKNYGIDVVTLTVGDLSQLQEKFDLITLSGVLEHLYDPNPAIANIRKLLSDGGLFYVNVPDAGAFVKYLDGPYQQFSIEHIQYFTEAALVNLMKINGFQPVRLIASAQPYTLTYSYPGIEGIFRKASAGSWEYEEKSESSLRDYIRVSRDLANRVETQLEKVAESGEPILVWGVGTNTQRLMMTGPLARANIVAFVDSNSHYHGKLLMNRPIISPLEVADFPHPVLVATFIFREEIRKQIREKLGYSNPLLFLGDDGPFQGRSL